MGSQRPKVMYLSHAGEGVYTLLRAAAGADFEVLALERDDDAERFRLLADCEAVICAATPLRKAHLDAAPKLRVVHHQGVGWQDTTDWREIKRRGLLLALTLEGTTEGVAEHTILLMLAACKRLPHADAELRQGRWHVNALRARSRELFGKTIGYVGMGRIAQAVAERLRPFGCDGVFVDAAADLSEARRAALGLVQSDLEGVLRAADVLSIHVPKTEATAGLIDARALSILKPGAILVNTARGGIVDETALAAALRDGRVLAAGLDVFDQEPPAPDHPLLGLDNVVLTPHIAAGTRDAMQRKMAALFDNLRDFFANGRLRNQVTFP